MKSQSNGTVSSTVMKFSDLVKIKVCRWNLFRYGSVYNVSFIRYCSRSYHIFKWNDLSQGRIVCLYKTPLEIRFMTLLESFSIWWTFKEKRRKIISEIMKSTCEIIKFLLLCPCLKIIECESQWGMWNYDECNSNVCAQHFVTHMEVNHR